MTVDGSAYADDAADGLQMDCPRHGELGKCFGERN